MSCLRRRQHQMELLPSWSRNARDDHSSGSSWREVVCIDARADVPYTRVGVVSDSFFTATEIVRRRVFADFSVAHLMKFRRGVASGEITLCQAMSHSAGCQKHNLCKQNVLLHLCEQLGLEAEHVLAVGDGEPDACMLAVAGISVAFEPKTDVVRNSAQHVLSGSLFQILPLVG